MDEEELLIQDFIHEAEEHLEDIEVKSVNLEQDGADGETINSLFRSFHTIKGNAKWLGFEPIVNLTHAIESLLGDLRNNKISLSTPMIDMFLNVKDLVQKQVDQVKTKETIDVLGEEAINQIEEFREEGKN